MAQFKYFKDVVPLDAEAEIAKLTELYEQFNIPQHFENTHRLLDILEEKLSKNKMQKQKLQESIKVAKSEETQLKTEISEYNVQLEELKAENYVKKLAIEERRKELPSKELPSKEEMDELRIKKASLKKELKDKQEAMLKEFKSFNIMTHYYKTHLDCHVDLEEPDKVIFEFEKRRERNVRSKCYVTLSTPDGKTFELVDLHPMLECRDQLAQRLKETNDVTALLVNLRKQYKPFLKE